jgi:hypothetical protein
MASFRLGYYLMRRFLRDARVKEHLILPKGLITCQINKVKKVKVTKKSGAVRRWSEERTIIGANGEVGFWIGASIQPLRRKPKTSERPFPSRRMVSAGKLGNDSRLYLADCARLFRLSGKKAGERSNRLAG